MIDKKNIKWVILAIAVVLIFYMKGAAVIPKDAVADIEGETCVLDADCPCLGKYNVTQYGSSLTDDQATAWGLGVGNCKNGACDMGYCADLTPAGEWFKEKPMAWAQTDYNIIYVFAVAGLIIVGLVMPK